MPHFVVDVEFLVIEKARVILAVDGDNQEDAQAKAIKLAQTRSWTKEQFIDVDVDEDQKGEVIQSSVTAYATESTYTREEEKARRVRIKQLLDNYKEEQKNQQA